MGHWYRKDGSPAHFEGKDGKGTTLREARKLDLFPSVTTVGQVVAKFALTNWLQEEAAIMAAEKVGRRISGSGDMTEVLLLIDGCDRSWAKSVVAASREKTMAKADAGTDIHDVLERFHNHMEIPSSDGKPDYMCAAVMQLIEDKTGLDYFDDFKAETRFCDTGHGYAGMCDLHFYESAHVGRKGSWVIDYKSKDTVDEKTRGWPENAQQLAAYARGLGIPNARLANVFISRENPTDVKWFEHTNTEYHWSCFLDALHLWQKTKKFGPWYDSWVESKEVS